LVYQLGCNYSKLLYRYFVLALLLVGVCGFANAEQINLDSGLKSKTIEVGKQVQIAADLKNNQGVEQRFAYIVQVQNENGITVSLAWITGQLTPGQSFTPSLSWTPDTAGHYDATIFVWESIDNPTALSPTLSLRINVQSST